MRMRPPLRLELLEPRRCLTVAVEVTAGDLLIHGEPDGPVVVTADEDGAFQVTDNGVSIQAVREDGSSSDTFTGADDIRIELDGDNAGTNDQVTLDLNAQSVDRVMVNLGSGDNRFSVEDGTIERGLKYRGQDGDDELVITDDVIVDGNVSARMGDGNNTVVMDGSVKRHLMVKLGDGDDLVRLGETANVDRSVFIGMGDGDNQFSHAGQISGSLRVHSGAGDDIVEILAGALVERSTWIALGDGDNDITIQGDLNDNMAYRGGAGQDSANLAESAGIAGNVWMRLGAGDNSVLHAGSIAGSLRVTSASEDDTIEISESAVVGGTTDLTPGGEATRPVRHFGHHRPGGVVHRLPGFGRGRP